MSKRFPRQDICFTWQSWATDELPAWAIEYSPCMGEVELFAITTPDGRDHPIDELDSLRGLHAMIGEAIKKAEEVPPVQFERKERT